MFIPEDIIIKLEVNQFQEYLSISQECAKAAVPDICSLPIQANRERQIMGVSFDLNDTAVKIGRVFNTQRNTRFMKECRDAEQYPDRKAFVPPTIKQVGEFRIFDESLMKQTLQIFPKKS